MERKVEMAAHLNKMGLTRSQAEVVMAVVLDNNFSPYPGPQELNDAIEWARATYADTFQEMECACQEVAVQYVKARVQDRYRYLANQTAENKADISKTQMHIMDACLAAVSRIFREENAINARNVAISMSDGLPDMLSRGMRALAEYLEELE